MPSAEEIAAKEAALRQCVEQQKALLSCFEDSSLFTWCGAEQKAFWSCYERERGGIRLRPVSDLVFGGNDQGDRECASTTAANAPVQAEDIENAGRGR